MIVYMATNRINGKIYVGKTQKTLAQRISKHMERSKVSNLHFYAAIKKYGFDNFEWSILKTCNSLEDLNTSERFFIEKMRSNDRLLGYNIGAGGEGGDNITFNPRRAEIIERNRIAQTGKRASLETKKKMSATRRGKQRIPISQILEQFIVQKYQNGVSIDALKKVTGLSATKVYYILDEHDITSRDFETAKSLRKQRGYHSKPLVILKKEFDNLAC